MDEIIAFLSAHELLAAYATRRLSPVEVVDVLLARMERIEPCINALTIVATASALEAARASEARWRQGCPLGLLDGVPVTVKDSIDAAGIPTRRGTSALGDALPAEDDAPAVARLKENGAVLLGKTTMPDFGMMASGLSSLSGITRNPWNLTRNSGGSSAGAGAALAAGIGPLALGSDIGGSIRIPASFCGVVGLKPSQGRVPIAEPAAGLVHGPMARDVVDTALLLRVLARPDIRDYTALPSEDRDYLAPAERGVKGHRIGLLLDAGFGLPTSPAVRAAVTAIARGLEDMGAIIEPMPPLFDFDPEPGFDLMLQAYAWPGFSALRPDRQALVLPEIAAWCCGGASISGQALIAATNDIAASRRHVAAACCGHDFVVAPVMSVSAYAAELPWPSGGTRHNPFCFPFNLSEQPALTICCGFDADRLPIGVQIIGRRFDDAGVLRLGLALETARCQFRFPNLAVP